MNTLTIQESQKLFEHNSAPSLFRNEVYFQKKNTGVGDFSFFPKPVTNTIPSAIISIKDAYEAIISTRYATPTYVLRSLLDKDTARKYKARNFDYICASGEFNTRCEAGLIRHSNLLTIDFDHVAKLNKLKNELIQNPYFETVLAFFSPSGDGLKWIVKIDLAKNSHLEWFLAIQAYIKTNYKLDIDKSGKDISRCCFLPYDPYAYINEKYL
jgi:hypothetical protein